MFEMNYVKCLVVGYSDVTGDPVLHPVVLEVSSKDLHENRHRAVAFKESGLPAPVIVIDSRYEQHEQLLSQFSWGEASFINMAGEQIEYPATEEFNDWLYEE